MSDATKKILEKKGQGEYEFTPYGEFLSYFHAHIDIFKKILKVRKVDPNQIEALIKATKAYMTANIKKTDHFFEHLPQFATLLGVPQAEISSFLNNNFIEVVTKVKEKLKSQETEKLQNVPEKSYDRITEEIIEKLNFSFPSDWRFAERGILLVLENIKTGELIEPKGLMAESARAALAVSGSPDEKKEHHSLTEALTQANAPPPPPAKKSSIFAEKEKSILIEIVESVGSSLTGESLDIQIGPEVSEQDPEPTGKSGPAKDDYEIEDIEFEGDSDSSSEAGEEADDSGGSDKSDFDDFLDSTPESEEEEPPPSDPYLEIAEKYSVREFIELITVISGFQQKADQAGYQNWMRAQGEFEKTVISLRTYLQKEQKNEIISWDQIFEGIISKTQFQTGTLSLLLLKLRNFILVKMTLDRAILELKKGSPEFVNLVRMAWPHIQKAFYDIPNYEQVQRSLKGILGRVGDEAHKKEFSRIFSMALNYIQSKYKV